MSKIFKILGVVIGLVILLIIVGGILLVTLVKPNDLKPIISQQVYKQTGRTLTIQGDTHWTLFPSIGFDFKDAQLSNLPEFGNEPFVKVGTVKISVKLWPLFHKQIEAEKLIIDGATINLIKNKQGVANWQNFKSGQSPADNGSAQKIMVAPAIAPAAMISKNAGQYQLSISTIDIKNVAVNWQDLQAGQQVQISNLTFQASDISDKKFFPVKLAFDGQSNQPQIKGNLSLNSQIKIDIEQQEYQLQNLVLITKLQGADLPQGKLDTALKSDITITPDSLDVEQLQLTLNDNEITGNVKINGFKNVTDFDLAGLLQKLVIQGKFQANQLKVNALTINQVQTNLNSQNGILRIAPLIAKVYSGDLNSTINVNAQQKAPQVSWQYTYNNFNLQSLLRDQFKTAKFSGTGFVQGNLTFQSFDENTIFKTLNGQVRFKLANGAVQGIDVAQLIYAGRALLKQQMPQIQRGANQTTFNSITGTVVIKNGVATNNDLFLDSKDLQAKGYGSANLISQQLNYYLEAGLTGDLSQWSIPIIIAGNFMQPKIQLDTQKILQNAAKQVIKKQIENILGIDKKKMKIEIPGLF